MCVFFNQDGQPPKEIKAIEEVKAKEPVKTPAQVAAEPAAKDTAGGKKNKKKGKGAAVVETPAEVI